MKLPSRIMPVVKILRRDVPKPKTRLKATPAPRFTVKGTQFCPMGRHPTARWPVPSSPSDFADGPMRDLPIEATYNFWQWFDYLSLKEAREAVDLIWPKKK